MFSVRVQPEPLVDEPLLDDLLRKICMSSANRRRLAFVIHLVIELTNKINRSVLMWSPWGTPNDGITDKSDTASLTLTNGFRPVM